MNLIGQYGNGLKSYVKIIKFLAWLTFWEAT